MAIIKSEVAIQVEGDEGVTTGYINGPASVGDTITITAKDDGGVPFKATGVCVEVLSEEEA